MLMDPHPNQQHAGLHHADSQLQQEVTRPKAEILLNHGSSDFGQKS